MGSPPGALPGSSCGDQSGSPMLGAAGREVTGLMCSEPARHGPGGGHPTRRLTSAPRLPSRGAGRRASHVMAWGGGSLNISCRTGLWATCAIWLCPQVLIPPSIWREISLERTLGGGSLPSSLLPGYLCSLQVSWPFFWPRSRFSLSLIFCSFDVICLCVDDDDDDDYRILSYLAFPWLPGSVV